MHIRCHCESARAKSGGDAGLHRCRARRVPQAKVSIANVGRESQTGDQPRQSSPRYARRIRGERGERYTDEEVHCRDEEHHA
jgi:hypothetical protein